MHFWESSGASGLFRTAPKELGREFSVTIANVTEVRGTGVGCPVRGEGQARLVAGALRERHDKLESVNR